ncbi:hypothetical protein Q3G72_001249 [Acer saccharum]|nr:hypothetical protein Q3G72_001249 [Acer saccharum]
MHCHLQTHFPARNGIQTRRSSLSFEPIQAPLQIRSRTEAMKKVIQALYKSKLSKRIGTNRGIGSSIKRPGVGARRITRRSQVAQVVNLVPPGTTIQGNGTRVHLFKSTRVRKSRESELPNWLLISYFSERAGYPFLDLPLESCVFFSRPSTSSGLLASQFSLTGIWPSAY